METNVQVERNELMNWLKTVNDIDLLKELKGIMKRTSKKDLDYKLTEEERQSVERGIEDANNGRVTPHEEVRKIYEKYL